MTSVGFSKKMVNTTNRQSIQATFRKFSELFSYLPKIEQDLISYILRNMAQKEIAKILGVTQGAVSSRQKRALQRLIFLKEIKKFNSADLEKEFSSLFNEFDIKMIKIMAETTCQSETANILNKLYNLSDNEKMTQVKVRYKFEKCLNKIKKELSGGHLDPDTYKKYLKLHKFLSLIKSNLYKLHEVKLPNSKNKTY